MAEWRKLKVSYLEERDIYRDLVRINADSRGRTVKEGKVYKVRARGGKAALLAIRGADDQGVIQMDAVTRRKLGLAKDGEYPFKFTPAGLIGQWRWSLQASDPGARSAAQLGALSVLLGLLSLILALLPIVSLNSMGIALQAIWGMVSRVFPTH